MISTKLPSCALLVTNHTELIPELATIAQEGSVSPVYASETTVPKVKAQFSPSATAAKPCRALAANWPPELIPDDRRSSG